MKKFIISIFLSSVFLSAACAEQGQAYSNVEDQGQLALRSGDYDKAAAIFKRGQRVAADRGESDWVTKFYFNQGNVALVEAEKTGKNIDALARSAIKYYSLVLNDRPTSGSTMVNTARAYAMMDEHKQAKKWYETAINLKDKKQTVYRKQYASYLQETDPKAAVKQLNIVMESKPRSRSAQKRLVSLYQQKDLASQLPKHLMQQVENGDVLVAQRAALDALANPEWPEAHKAKLFEVVAASLAAQAISPAEFAKSKTADELKAIGESVPSVKKGVDELLATYDISQSKIDYVWWTKNKARTARLSKLLRSSALHQQRSGRLEKAESLLLNAVEIRGKGDPAALRDLVEFYSERNDTKKIKDISKQYEFVLFRGKGNAYRKNDISAIYEYHRTLASIYAYDAKRTGDWGSPNDSTSAAFQLEHAYDTANRSSRIIPDTDLVDLLAQSYTKTKTQKDSDALRLDAATMYKRTGNIKAAATVLQPIDKSKLTGSTLSRYQQLRIPSSVQPGIINNRAIPTPNLNIKPQLKDIQQAPITRSDNTISSVKNTTQSIANESTQSVLQKVGSVAMERAQNTANYLARSVRGAVSRSGDSSNYPAPALSEGKEDEEKETDGAHE